MSLILNHHNFNHSCHHATLSRRQKTKLGFEISLWYNLRWQTQSDNNLPLVDFAPFPLPTDHCTSEFTLPKFHCRSLHWVYIIILFLMSTLCCI